MFSGYCESYSGNVLFFSVCISVLERFVKETPDADITDKARLEKKFQKFCKGLKGRDEKIVSQHTMLLCVRILRFRIIVLRWIESINGSAF